MIKVLRFDEKIKFKQIEKAKQKNFKNKTIPKYKKKYIKKKQNKNTTHKYKPMQSQTIKRPKKQL